MATTLSLLRFAPLPPRLTRPSIAVNLSLRSNQSARIRPRLSPVSASYTVPATDRLLSAVSYTLPLLNSLPFGRFLISRYPLLASVTSPFFPMVAAFHSVPYAGIMAFFALYLALARNPEMNGYVRFNAMQAVVLDVILGFPVLVQRVLGTPTGRVLQYTNSAIFVVGFSCFVYSVFCCLVGITPYLPFVSSAANRQL